MLFLNFKVNSNTHSKIKEHDNKKMLVLLLYVFCFAEASCNCLRSAFSVRQDFNIFPQGSGKCLSFCITCLTFLPEIAEKYKKKKIKTLMLFFLIFISIFIILTCRKTSEASYIVRLLSNHLGLLPKIPRYFSCCPIRIFLFRD